MIAANDALERLKQGNARFAANVRDMSALASKSRRHDLLDGQEPFAIVLGCSDSRVPAELVFDQGLGDLFVIRVAGNIVAPSLIGSVEFSARLHNVKLVVVLGHTQCGAINATVDELEQPSSERSPNLAAIVNRIRPSVTTLVDAGLGGDREALVHHATRANVRASVSQLRTGSVILEDLIAHEGLQVVGAEYSLETGVVDFFDADLDGEYQGSVEH
jgi:carbonic anhydrase